jgi:hypothetical protein
MMRSRPEALGGHPLTGSGMMGSHHESLEGNPLTATSTMDSHQDSIGRHPLMGTDMHGLDGSDQSISSEFDQVPPPASPPPLPEQ